MESTNLLIAYSKDKEVLDKIKEFIEANFYNWDCLDLDEDLEISFSSKTFPEKDMKHLYKQLNKSEYFQISCLTYDFETLTHSMWNCTNTEEWYEC